MLQKRMGSLQKFDRHTTELERIRAIIGRHQTPSFVSGFNVEFGEFDGDPAMWITFHTVGQPTGDRSVMKARGNELVALQRAVQADLLSEIDDFYPYFRFLPTPASHSGAN